MNERLHHFGRGPDGDGAAPSPRPSPRDTGEATPANPTRESCTHPSDWIDLELDMKLLRELGGEEGHLQAWIEDQFAERHPDWDIDAIEWEPRIWSGPFGGQRLIIAVAATLYTRRPDDGDEDAEYERVRDEVTA